MTIKEVYEYLESIKKIDCILENKVLEKEELYALVTKTTQVLSDMPRGFSQSDKMANLTCEMVEIDNEIAETIKLLLNFKKEVISNLQKIANVYQYETLYLLYIENKTITEVAECIGGKKGIDTVTPQWVQKLKQRGVENLSNFLTKSENYKKILKMTKPFYKDC